MGLAWPKARKTWGWAQKENGPVLSEEDDRDISQQSPFDPERERGREVSEAEVWCQSGVRDKMEQAGVREGQERDWSGKGEGLDEGLAQETMLMFAWIVFLKGLLLLHIVVDGGYTGIYNFKIHWTKIIAFVVC